RIANDDAGSLCALSGLAGQVGGTDCALRSRFDGCRDLVKRRSSLFEACCLLFGAARQIISGLADLTGPRAHALDRPEDRRHRLLKLFGRTVEIILQRLRLRTEGLCHAERQIATGQRSKSAADRGDRNLIFLGSACLFGLVELAFALGHVANAFSLALDRKSTRLNSSHVKISYAVFCLKKK